MAFGAADLDWEQYVKIDEKFYRPAEVELLIGDATKAKEKLGWVPKISFEQMITEMVESDMAALAEGI